MEELNTNNQTKIEKHEDHNRGPLALNKERMHLKGFSSNFMLPVHKFSQLEITKGDFVSSEMTS